MTNFADGAWLRSSLCVSCTAIAAMFLSGKLLAQAVDRPTGTSLFAPPRQRAATRGQPHTAPPRSESFVALREHHPRHDPHQHDHDGRNPRDNRPSPPAFFQLAQLALQIHPPSGERVR
jgi:hypothetical protein